jgi:nicotinate-nucleotide adenylyltransferase
MATRIGLMGGTFDPVHYGHLFIAEAARVELGLERVIWVPAGDPPHKAGPHRASQEHRYALTLLATASNPCFEVTRLELERQGPSYSIDTIDHFRREYPGAEVFFIAGADSILEIRTRHRHEDLIRVARFAAAPRPGYDLERLSAVLPPEYLERIDLLPCPPIDLSSTDLRRRVERALPIRYLVPEAVEAYIGKHGLYAASAADDRPVGSSSSIGPRGR